ncbi:MAG TPA: pantoate--beta-alanine ligase [Candidatus Nanopelagicales bacterium]|nr:pantoate--beta-alanine ligase [Candidatus Nanopelagicales bacterium]
MTQVVATRPELAAALAAAPGRRAVVMTMGALHDGHLQLVREARRLVGEGGHVTVTIFVNPLQFAPGEDLATYPRTMDADLEACRAEGVDVVFAPAPDAVYPDGDPRVTIDPGELGTELEGAIRPGHFRGVLTVVAKLLSLTRADVAVFGEKDYQQLTLIRRMVGDLDLGVEIVGVATVRAADGLALSSRNAYLSDDQRRLARAVPAALAAGREAAAAGGGASEAEAAVLRALTAYDVTVDYAVVRDRDLGPAPANGEARLLVAVRVGSVRLLDNCRLVLGAPA